MRGNNELRDLARDLAKAGASAPARAAAVVAAGAQHVKANARKNAEASAGTHAALYPQTIGFDLSRGGLAADIGPSREGQGSLGPILEYGSINNQPHRDLGRAMDVEEPLFLAEAAKLTLPWL